MSNHQNPHSELFHYGVKGMKWGVRRSQASLDRAAGRVRSSVNRRREASRAKRSDDHNKTADLRKKKVSQLSNQELKDLTERLRLEDAYTSLKDKQKKARADKGRQFVNDAEKVIAVANSPVGKWVIDQAVGKVMGGRTPPRRKKSPPPFDSQKY